MKILFVSHHLKGNDGWSRYARDFLLEMKNQGNEVLCLVNELSPETNVPQNKCLDKHLKYLANPFLSWRTASRVNSIIESFSPNIIHIIVEPYGTIIPFLKPGRAKILITVHSTFAFMPILLKGFRKTISTYLTKLMYKKIDHIICVSKYTKNHLIKHMSLIGEEKLLENKTSVLAGGVDVSSAGMVSAVRKTNEKSKKEILFVGAVKPRKGLKEALEALALVKTDFIYRIAGSYKEDDGYCGLLKKLIKEKKLDDKVLFLGQVSDSELENLYKNADLFLMLSTNNGADFEGYGLVYLEANLRGVPCIGPRDSGVSEAIVDGKSGFLVDQYDSPVVARMVERVLNERVISPEDCIDWARENAIEKKTEILKSIYKSLLK